MGLQRREPGNYLHNSDPGEATAGNAPRISITEEEAELLAAAVTPGGFVLEIGTGLGVSTRALARDAGWVHTVDPDPWVRDVIVPDLPRNVTHWRSVGEFMDEWFIPGDSRLEMIFIDGSHDYESVRIDTQFAIMINPKQIWWHDGYMQSVQVGISACGVNPELVLVNGRPTLTHLLCLTNIPSIAKDL